MDIKREIGLFSKVYDTSDGKASELTVGSVRLFGDKTLLCTNLVWTSFLSSMMFRMYKPLGYGL